MRFVSYIIVAEAYAFVTYVCISIYVFRLYCGCGRGRDDWASELSVFAVGSCVMIKSSEMMSSSCFVLVSTQLLVK